MSNLELNIIRRAQKGEEAAFNELYELFYKQAYYLALKITNCDADAKDAAQETFITIQTSIKDLREIKKFRKWMAMIVVSKCNKIFRKNKYTILDPDIINTVPIEEQRDYMTGNNYVRKQQQKQELMELLSNLTKNQREVLVLMYLEQFSIKEIGAALQIPEGTVKSRLVSAKAALKRQIMASKPSNSFRSWGWPISIVLILAYRKEALQFTGQAKHLIASIPRPAHSGLLTALVIGGSVTVGSIVLVTNYKNTNASLSQATFKDGTGTYTEQAIYYKLRDWAHCHVEMKQKTADEYAEILPYYEFLKEMDGPYYQRLSMNQWNFYFDKYKR